MKITEKVKTFEDACAIKKIEPVVPEFQIPEELKPVFVALFKLLIITEVLNEGWKPDFTDWSQSKWFVYVYSSNAGQWCAYSATSPASALAHLGARLCFKSSGLCEYARDQFKELYITYLAN